MLIKNEKGKSVITLRGALHLRSQSSECRDYCRNDKKKYIYCQLKSKFLKRKLLTLKQSNNTLVPIIQPEDGNVMRGPDSKKSLFET